MIQELNKFHQIFVAPFMGAWIEIKVQAGKTKVTELVAPFMGAWIEISGTTSQVGLVSLSHPLWVRGLKYRDGAGELPRANVAPFMGAWIEMANIVKFVNFNDVAPFMGAWIEIPAICGADTE